MLLNFKEFVWIDLVWPDVTIHHSLCLNLYTTVPYYYCTSTTTTTTTLLAEYSNQSNGSCKHRWHATTTGHTAAKVKIFVEWLCKIKATPCNVAWLWHGRRQGVKKGYSCSYTAPCCSHSYTCSTDQQSAWACATADLSLIHNYGSTNWLVNLRNHL